MSASVADIIEGTSLKQEDDGKYTLSRTFIVTGLSGTASQRVMEALSVTGIPAFREAHPTISGLVVASRDVNVIDQENAQITCTYKSLTIQLTPPSETSTPQITVGSSVQPKDINLDINGDLMVVEYTPEGEATAIEQTGTVSVMLPQTIYRYSRLEPSDPSSKSVTYTGKVNSTSFKGGAAGTWLCTRIEGTSTDGGESFQVEYEFQYNQDGWAAVVCYIDPETGAPPGDLVDNTGIRAFEVYAEIDFSGLSL
jgi:hypothetical protein